jgi:hypothetical protein
MNLIFNNPDEFILFIPTAAGSNLDDLLPFIGETETWLQNEFLGTPLYEHIRDLGDTEIKNTTKAVIALHAYLAAIPFVDLIQTPNGFAVVSNSNQAPASRERVERLILFVKKRLSAAIDTLVHAVFKSGDLRNGWAGDVVLFNRHSEIVYITTGELKRYSANPDATYEDLFASHPQILALQTEVARYVSASYLDELIAKRRTDALNLYDGYVFSAVQIIIGLKMQKAQAYPMIEQMVNFMTEHPDEFPLYMASPEYRLKISGKYENRRSHPTFFFGG